MKKTATVGDLLSALSQSISPAELKTALITSEISAQITKERINRGMTQKEFASFLGVSQPMISKWEAGDYNFTISAISDIFEKLELDYSFNILNEKKRDIKVIYNSTPKLPNLFTIPNINAIA